MDTLLWDPLCILLPVPARPVLYNKGCGGVDPKKSYLPSCNSVLVAIFGFFQLKLALFKLPAPDYTAPSSVL